MARLNEVLVGRFNRAFQKIYGIKGGPPVATLAPEIMPSHVIFTGVEHRFTEAWTKWAIVAQVTGAAANLGALKLRNPVGSNVIAVVEKLAVFAAASQIISLTYGPETVNFASLNTITSIDGRQSATSAQMIASSQTTTPAGNTALMNVPVTANAVPYDVILEEQMELTIPPGFGIEDVSGSNNTSISWAVWWRERFLEEGERT